MIKQTFQTRTGTIEAIEGTFLFFRTTAGDTAVFAGHEIDEEETKKEIKAHGATEIEETHKGIGIRFQGQKAFYSVVATISDVPKEIKDAGF